jgi:crossover junction endodeoxyribonuclease RusA
MEKAEGRREAGEGYHQVNQFPKAGEYGIICIKSQTLAIFERMCYNRTMTTYDITRARFELPLPPGINQQYATVNGRRVLSKASRQYKKEAGKTIRRLRREGVISDELVTALREGHVGLFIDFYFETPHRRDLDGGLKITQDAICNALGVNDNRVVDVHLVKRIDPLRTRIEVELEAIPHWEFDTQYVYTGDGDGRGTSADSAPYWQSG